MLYFHPDTIQTKFQDQTFNQGDIVTTNIMCSNGGKSPIDVYDAAAWMCITPLSDLSSREGSRPVEIPDFTLIK